MKKLTLSLALCAGLANAQTVDNWTSANGTPWKNSTGQCWRNASWTPATAHPDCDGALKPAPQVAQAPAAKVDVSRPTAALAPRVATTPPQIVKSTFSTDTLFDFDKSVLKPEGKQALDNLIDKLKNLNVEVVIVVGHTDSVGTDAYNMKLGDRRAQSVKAYLVTKGIDSKRIYTDSKGERQPVADNKTASGRAKNRRVDIEVVGMPK